MPILILPALQVNIRAGDFLQNKAMGLLISRFHLIRFDAPPVKFRSISLERRFKDYLWLEINFQAPSLRRN